MNSREKLRQAAAELREAGVPDPVYDSALILSWITGVPPLELRAGRETEMSEAREARFREMIRRRKGREPLQYLIGSVIFCGREFRVGPGTLIPRPETELLTEWAAERLRETPGAEVLDLCCGSGCIGLSLAAERPDLRVCLTDLSPEALAWAERNRAELGLDCEILRGDLFEAAEGRRFDCVLSNPPYIPSAECGRLQPELNWEPAAALDGGADGMDFYRRIAAGAPRYLKTRGFVLMETGDGEAEAAAELLRAGGARRTEIRKDYAGISRMVLGEYEDVCEITGGQGPV